MGGPTIGPPPAGWNEASVLTVRVEVNVPPFGSCLVMVMSPGCGPGLNVTDTSNSKPPTSMGAQLIRSS